MRIENLEKCVSDTLDSMNTIEALERFLSFCGKGNMYLMSAENLFAIYAQEPDATVVTTFDGWKAHGRYPLQNKGIAVYPFNTTGVFGRFTDYLFDVTGTKGKEIKVWSITDEIREKYFEYRKKHQPGEDDYVNYFKSIFYNEVISATFGYHTELLFSDDEIGKRTDVHRFINECILKVFLNRCEINYSLPDEAASTFQKYFIMQDASVDTALLMKCMKVVQEVVVQELELLSNYVVYEKRRAKNERGSVDGQSRGNSGESKSDDEESAGRRDVIRNDGSGSTETSGTGESRDIPGSGVNVGGETGMGKNDSGVSDGPVSGAAADTDSKEGAGEDSGRESGGSEGDVRNSSPEVTGEGESVRDGYNAADSDREPDTAGDNGNYQSGDFVPPDTVLESRNNQEGQLDLFSYLSQKEDANIAAGNVSIDEPAIRMNFANRISNETINSILQAGPCGYRLDAKYKVFNYYSTNWDYIGYPEVTERAIDLIKREYAGASLGFNVKGKEISAFYDKEKGLLLAFGKEARLYPQEIIDWKEIEERIFYMVEDRQFIDATDEVLAAAEDAKSVVIEMIYYFFDAFDVGKDKLPEPFNSTRWLWPEIEEIVTKYISEPENAQKLLLAAKDLWERCEQGEFSARWRYAHDYNRVIHLESFLNGRYQFDLPEKLEVLEPSFVPYDAFDYSNRLYSKGKYETEYRMKLYAASEEGTNTQKTAAFLQSTFGDSGSGYSGIQRDHSSKGFSIKINLSRGKDSIITAEMSNINMAKRICKIIQRGKFFLPGEAVVYPTWKKNKDEEKAATEAFTKQVENEHDRLSGENKGYVNISYLTSSEHTELHREVAWALFNSRKFDDVRNAISIVLTAPSFPQKEKENFVHAVFTYEEDKIIPLKGYDFAKKSTAYSERTRFGSEAIGIYAFPENYITTTGWVSYHNWFTISFEEITAIWLSKINENIESIIEDEDRWEESPLFEDVIEDYLLRANLAQSEDKSLDDVTEVDASIASSPDTTEIIDVDYTEEAIDTVPEELPEEKPEDNLEYIGTQLMPKDYTYSADWIPNTGSNLSRFKLNLEAIKVLKQIEEERRYATREEQEVLSKYVGWGGLSMFFDENLEQYSEEKAQLKELLTEAEYKSARSSVTDSFYTPRSVIQGVYQALKHFGFRGGNVLEPAVGIGNFYNDMPSDMREKSCLYGVEIDSISGRIAKLLHPNANIQITGLENAKLPQNFFDCIIGNVPFGEFKVNDKKFNKENFLIHDYFFAKALDLCAPGGIVAFVTSKGTLDKKNGTARKYISERADFLGAIRLPNTTFADSANTEVTSDIIFLQKKFAPSIVVQDFETVEMYKNTVPLNSYFVSYPYMMLGSLEIDSQRYGPEGAFSYLVPHMEADLADEIQKAVSFLPANVYERLEPEIAIGTEDEPEVESIPADSSVKNYTYAIRDGKVYMRENSRMYLKDKLPELHKKKITQLCGIREVLHELIDMQMDGCREDELKECQERMSRLYDAYVAEHGFINSKETKRVFCDDVEYTLLCALEDAEENTYVKAKIFTQQTIYPHVEHDSADSAVEALNITVADYGYVNMENVVRIYKHTLEDVLAELGTEVYLNPERADAENPYKGYETKEEYLSGDVRKKLAAARLAEWTDKKYSVNVESLEKVIPQDLDASEIEVKIGSNWIEPEDYQDFIYEKFKIPRYDQKNCYLEYNRYVNTYFIQGKTLVETVETSTTYGTKRMSALEIFENLLNVRQIKVRDRIDNPNGSVSYVVNMPETTLARAKADMLKEEFQQWLFDNLERREKYVRIYNDRFNNIRLREYDGSFLTFPGMNPEIAFRPHQSNAVARAIRGGNTLLGHCVGAGKSFVMAAIAMELRRLHLANKPMIVVPNHLTGQMAAEFLKLYPSANVLLTTKRDFEKSRRKRFVSKIATGDYDAVIIGHSQFEKIPISQARMEANIEHEIDEIQRFIARMKEENHQSWSVKQMEAQEKQLRLKLEILANEDYKDDVITFEELGVDCIMVDEAHNYKNLTFNTKIGNVAGINPNGSNKAFDLLQKVQYINSMTPGRNVIFATGTPISNTMCEMYIMQKYLQADLLKERDIYHFDAWAANYGDLVTAMELTPEGKGYREKTRFARFTNLPELVTMFRMVADIQTQNMLPYLDIPTLIDGKYDIVESEPNDDIVACVDKFVERAKAVRDGLVDSSVDNMLKICHDAKLVSTDIRMLYPGMEPDPESKLYKCVEKIYEYWVETTPDKGAQAVFSDIGVPNAGKSFNVYQFIKDELVKKGIPAEEICFIHDAKNDKERSDMFKDVRNGVKRIIIGSTEKMGTGTNIQTRLFALHEVDVPWRPSDVEQREGRGLRQGNMYDSIHVVRYVTKGTFDAYNWSIIENKQKFISQIMTDGAVARSCTDIDEAVLNYAEMAAIASGNPLIKEKMEVDAEVTRLQLLKRSFVSSRYNLEKELKITLPERKEQQLSILAKIKADIEMRDKSPLFAKTNTTPAILEQISETDLEQADNSEFSMMIAGQEITERKKAGELLMDMLVKCPANGERIDFAQYAGFTIGVRKKHTFYSEAEVSLLIVGNAVYTLEASMSSALGNIARIQNCVRGLETKLEEYQNRLAATEAALISAQEEFDKPFAKEEQLAQLLERQKELNEELMEESEEKDKQEVEVTDTSMDTVRKPKMRYA